MKMIMSIFGYMYDRIIMYTSYSLISLIMNSQTQSSPEHFTVN